MKIFNQPKNQKVFLLFISGFALALLNTACKPDPKPVSEEEGYALLNEVILDDSLVIRDIYYKLTDFELSDEMKKEFSKEEVEFIEKQISELKVKEVKPNKMIWFHRNYKVGDFVKLIHHADSVSMTHISFPIVSPDRKKLLIHMTSDCNCMLGGSGGDDLYVKKNGRWHWAKTFNGWIS